MSSEAACWRSLRSTMRGKWFVNRVENRVQEGMPDTYYVYHGHAGWIELKEANKVDDVVMRKSQVIWLRAHLKAGGHAFVLIRAKDGYHAVNVREIGLDGRIGTTVFTKRLSVGWLEDFLRG